ncbi:MAG: transposase, partial [Xanthomarina gelatinilytica]|uniref:IS110 family transposase n=1 Tax=Xanthomarina gelatinilytica TaxID=1137281 RepID=UPI003A880C85
MKVLKLSSGLDISKSDFHACLVLLQEDQHMKIVKSRKFTNSSQGIVEYIAWFEKASKKYQLPVHHVMEATGVYHEYLAISLFKSEENLSVVLPNKSKRYIEALGFKTKNDKIDAQALAMMGAQQQLALWQPLGDYFYQLRAMTRMYQTYQENITALHNQIEALTYGMYKQTALIKDLQGLINRYKKLVEKLKSRIETHLLSDEEVARKVSGISKLKGLSIMTIAVLLAETNGFELFTN